MARNNKAFFFNYLLKKQTILLFPQIVFAGIIVLATIRFHGSFFVHDMPAKSRQALLLCGPHFALIHLKTIQRRKKAEIMHREDAYALTAEQAYIPYSLAKHVTI